MFYGYEQPVDMPVPELYDTGIMQMYLQAVKDQYDKGEKRMEDFISKYGDFTSPFQKDVEAYQNLGMGRINDIYDQLIAQGIDPLRSREGQAVMARAIRETPVDKLNQLKQSATIAKAYQSAVQDAMRKGEYDPGFEQYLLKQAGVDSFDKYSTLENGMWNREAPGVYKTLGDATNTWYDEIQPTDKGRKNGFLWKGIDMNDLLNVAKPRSQAFANTQLGGYYKYLIKQDMKKKYPLATEQELEDATNLQFVKDIANTHVEKLKMLPETDPYAMLAEKDKYDRAAAARKFAYDMELARLKGELKNGSSGSNNLYPASESTVRNKTVTSTQKSNVINWLPSLVKSKINHWTSVMNKSKKGSKEYNSAKTYLDYWNAIKKNPYNPGKGLIPLLQYDKNGVVQPTKSLQARYDQTLGNSIRKGGSDATAKYINAKTTEFAGKTATRIKNNISNEWDVIPGTTSKNRTVDFGTGKFTLSSVKVKGMYGSRGSKLQRMFNSWLKSNNIRGYMTGETVRQDRQKGSTTSGVNTYYFNSYITGNKLAEFLRYYNESCKAKGYKPLSENAVMKHLGVVRDESKQFKDKNKETQYIGLFKFGISYTVKDNPAQSFEDIEYDKSQYGSKNAYNISMNRQGESLARTEDLE